MVSNLVTVPTLIMNLEIELSLLIPVCCGILLSFC